MKSDMTGNFEFDPQDVDWLAFCYLADELDQAQRIEFENRLEHDVQAQQALVAAVQDSQLVYAALNSTSFNDVADCEPVVRSVQRKPARSPGLLQALLGSAAAIVLVISGWAWLGSGDLTTEPALTESDQLANAWVETFSEMTDEDFDEFIFDELNLADPTDEHSDWMFVALNDLKEASEGADDEAY